MTKFLWASQAPSELEKVTKFFWGTRFFGGGRQLPPRHPKENVSLRKRATSMQKNATKMHLTRNGSMMELGSEVRSEYTCVHIDDRILFQRNHSLHFSTGILRNVSWAGVKMEDLQFTLVFPTRTIMNGLTSASIRAKIT